MATFVPRCSALLRDLESVDVPPLMRNEPMIEAIMPINATKIGNTKNSIIPSPPACSAVIASRGPPALALIALLRGPWLSSAMIAPANATSETGAMIEPAYDSNRSAPMPATSPTLSPTLSAMVAGLRGSSSGMPASTFPTRSAPTSAALVKMPPPTRENNAMVDAPRPKAVTISKASSTSRTVTNRT